MNAVASFMSNPYLAASASIVKLQGTLKFDMFV
jgi:hypothetical protein